MLYCPHHDLETSDTKTLKKKMRKRWRLYRFPVFRLPSTARWRRLSHSSVCVALSCATNDMSITLLEPYYVRPYLDARKQTQVCLFRLSVGGWVVDEKDLELTQ